MAETAVHLVDHVFFQVPVRQWVLSFPKQLRYLLFTATIGNIFFRKMLPDTLPLHVA